MTKPHLILGNKNYSSWSLRPWIGMAVMGVDFDETVLPLDTEEFKPEILKHSPAGQVPVLHHGDIKVWDSYAILEYMADAHYDLPWWPGDPHARALARAVASEMHSGFLNLRKLLPMNIRVRVPNFTPSDEAQKDIARVQAIWSHCRSTFGQGGDFLFGDFTIADAMFAPVVTRFETYQIDVPSDVRAYMDAIQSLPAMRAWTEASFDEPWAFRRIDDQYTTTPAPR